MRPSSSELEIVFCWNAPSIVPVELKAKELSCDPLELKRNAVNEAPEDKAPPVKIFPLEVGVIA